jgi:hypothetical protein
MDFERLFSAPRMSSYRRLVDTNTEAEQLYHWNIILSAAFYECLAILEVALRNAIDKELRLINEKIPDPDGVIHTQDWLLDPNYVIETAVSKKSISLARNRARESKNHPNHDDILAQMTFASWRYIIPSNSPNNFVKQKIWSEGLHQAFNMSDYSLSRFARDLKDLHKLRNRIAHVEAIVEEQYAKNTMRSIYRVAKSIDPELERYIKSTQRVTYINKQRPR